MAAPSEHMDAKVAFVSGLQGTTPGEVAGLIAVAPLGVFLSCACHRALGWRGAGWRLGVEALCLLAPCVAAVTKPEALPMLVAAMATAGFVALRSPRARRAAPQADAGNRDPDVAVMRFSLLLLTCLMILAIDFPVTPRRLGKSETFGTGLMDVGTGGFTIVNAVVVGTRDEDAGDRPRGYSQSRKVLKNVPLLLLLGAGRLASVRSSGYHEVVQEYGVHWNFFFTLAGTMLGVALLLETLPAALLRRPALLACAAAAAHQAALSVGGLQAWVLRDTGREDLLNANKEGLASLAGYVALYWAGVALGRTLRRDKAPENALATLLALGGAAAAGHLWLGVSRRLANAAYLAWALACAQQLVWMSRMLARHTGLDPRESVLLQSLGRLEMPVFLAANVLTGLCNLTFDTLSASAWQARGILMAYLIAVAALGWLATAAAAARASSGKKQ